MTTLHAQRTRAVVCATGDSGETGRLSVNCYVCARVRVARCPTWGATSSALLEGFRLRGLGCRSSFLVLVLDD